MGQGRPHALTLVVLAALLLPVAVAHATQLNYFGYGNLTASNPAAGTKCGSTNVAGSACSGYQYWDYTQADWTSGRSAFYLGFQKCEGCTIFGRNFNGVEAFGTYTLLWSDYIDGHYVRSHCLHLEGGSGTYNYIQCRALRFP